MRSRTKHIEIRHHFLREHIANGNCEIKFIGTEIQLANIFTKPLAKDIFNFMLNELGIISISCSQQYNFNLLLLVLTCCFSGSGSQL